MKGAVLSQYLVTTMVSIFVVVVLRRNMTKKENKPTILMILLIAAVVITSGCTALTEVSEPVVDTMEKVGNATCSDICNACQTCTEEMKDRGLINEE